ncbi:hypothetical protein [Plantibacter sp. YIM 135347]|uniref:DUF7882 family protein n=1 Tax=Plantibacter sp. YIM 135347 TaxID=3423919 RepID=UPI003D32A5C4
MGSIIYGSAAQHIVIDDETLCYIKTVAVLKLRRNETFTISCDRPDHGRLSIWVHPSIGLQFEFDGPASTTLDRERLEHMMSEVNSTGDLKAHQGAPV